MDGLLIKVLLKIVVDFLNRILLEMEINICVFQWSIDIWKVFHLKIWINWVNCANKYNNGNRDYKQIILVILLGLYPLTLITGGMGISKIEDMWQDGKSWFKISLIFIPIFRKISMEFINSLQRGKGWKIWWSNTFQRGMKMIMK